MGVKQEDINSLLNFAFISKHLNLQISNKYPSKYLLEYAAANPDLEAHLLTHFITPSAYQAAIRDDFQTFITERGNTILETINKVCRVNDEVKTLNSNIDEDEDEILLDGSIDEEVDIEEEDVRTDPKIWLIPSNNKIFNLPACFAKNGRVFWTQYNNFIAGDTGYIYCSSPDSALMYKVEIVGADMPYSPEIEERREFFKNPADQVLL